MQASNLGAVELRSWSWFGLGLNILVLFPILVYAAQPELSARVDFVAKTLTKKKKKS